MSVARVTLADVAARAGVSRTTASFVLSGRRDMRISADAAQRVTRSARELDYRPNLLARSLRTNQSQTIGFISDVIASEGFAGEAIRASVSTAARHQHLLFVGETAGETKVETLLVQSMLDRGVGGFVYACMATRERPLSRLLRSHPVVLMNCLTRSRSVACVIPDERSAGRHAAQALLDAGHREHIYLIGETPDHVHAARERRAGIEAVLAENGLRLAASIDALWWPNPACDAVSELLRHGERPSALICLNDRVAFGAYQALNAANLRIPDDVSVVSFDDSDLAGWLRPGLTSIQIPYFEMGRTAVELLLTPGTKPGIRLIGMPFRERDSIAEPGRAQARRASRSRSSRKR